MTGLEKMLEQIGAESDAACAELVADAEQKAASLLADASKQAEMIAADASSLAERKMADGLERARSAADLYQRKAVLQEKQAILSETIQNALQHLQSLPDEPYFALLIRMAANGALAQDGEMILSQKDKQRLPADFAEKLAKAMEGKDGSLTVSDQTRELDGGFVLCYGGVEENYAFTALFEANQERYQDLAQQILFGKADN